VELIVLFYILLFLVAFLYSSVGHGGASGYLALMAIFSFAPDIMKPTALLLNLFVSLTSFIQFYRGKHFNWKIFLPFAITSVPMAYIGGLITVDDNIYKKILGILLIIPIIRFLLFGFLSGLIGIGGGIILSPVLLLLKWTDMKQTAAISAIFIFVNSLSGLAGQLQKGIDFSPDMYAYVGVAFAGGLCGAYFGSLKLNQNFLKYLLAFVLIIASYKLLFTSA
jgi:uncharacterized membrane protein YfcA